MYDEVGNSPLLLVILSVLSHLDNGLILPFIEPNPDVNPSSNSEPVMGRKGYNEVLVGRYRSVWFRCLRYTAPRFWCGSGNPWKSIVRS